MKVDKIETRFGDIEVEYSSFTKGFFIKKFPEKLEQINGLKLLRSRDNSFREYKKLEDYVKDLLHNAMIDFEFERKVIAYNIRIDKYTDGISFEWMICDESVKNQKYQGKENQLKEYFVHDSNIKGYIGKRNIFGQIVFSSYNDFIFIDYDENIYNFFKDFTDKFQVLKSSIADFFDKEKVIFNILNIKNNIEFLKQINP
jgi:hypothetical protein